MTQAENGHERRTILLSRSSRALRIACVPTNTGHGSDRRVFFVLGTPLTKSALRLNDRT